MNFSTHSIFLSLSLLVVITIGCKTTEEPTDDDITTTTDTAAIDAEEASALQTTLNNNRSQLSDIYASQQHDMPEHFLKESTDKPLNNNPSDGFRIQIHSTRKVEVADSVAGAFRVWSDTTLTGYDAKAYESFRQPYYKVQVGDFQQRDQATEFLQLIKDQYPDAWIVHDRIEPSNAPADTTSFSLKTEEADSLDQ